MKSINFLFLPEFAQSAKANLKYLIICLLTFSYLNVQAQVNYPHVFNPVSSVLDDSEKPARDAICLNGTWQFMPVNENDITKFQKPQTFQWSTTPIKIPSPWNINSFSQGDGGDFLAYPSYPREWDRANMGWMRKSFTLPPAWSGKRVVLHFEAIAGYAKIYLNDKLVCENLDIFFPTRLDITDYLKEGSNEVLVGVAKASLTDIRGSYGRRNYVAGSFWGQHIAGIWQDVWLLAIPELAISDVFVQPDVQTDLLNFAVTIKNQSTKSQTFALEASILKWQKDGANDVVNGPVSAGYLTDEVLKINRPGNVTLKAGDSITVNIGRKVEGKLDFWTPETPRLYGSIISLMSGKNRIDTKYTRFGWRQFTVKGTELLLNGKPIVMKGDSWHFMGVPQMTRRYAWGWYKMLKDVNANAVRLHAQPYPSFYLDVADEVGICVLPETGIWSSDGGPKMDSDDYWIYCRKHVEDMVLRDRNHASVFGWSVCNETLPVVINVMRAPESIEKRQVEEINEWIRIVQRNDPTRNWISGDGEDMRPTDLPVVIGHYGDERTMRRWSSEGKPWGVGETGMGYYGTPKQIAAVNGNRAYESQLGRMEGLAVEAYNLITKQLELKASYASVFNIAWYGLKPLEFGLHDITRPSVPTDGIFFQPYKEGVPGMQPERLGPYASTINPGYDPALPLYDPWPMFDAIKAANAFLPYTIANTDEAKAKNAVRKPNSILETVVLASSESLLKEQWQDLGVPIIEIAKNKVPSFIIIDGLNPPIDASSKTLFNACLANGGTVLVWGVLPDKLESLNKILPFPLELTDRRASSLVKKANDEFLGALDNKDFYFFDPSPAQVVMQYGLSGEIVRGGHIILEAPLVDWGRWNGRPEPIKTAAVYRSEREAKPDGPAVVKVLSGKGQIYLVSLNLTRLRADGENLLRTIISNLGVTLKDVPPNTRKAFQTDGSLERAIYLLGRNVDESKLLTMNNAEFVANYEKGEPTIVQTDVQGSINLSRLQGLRQDDRAVYLSFWINSPRSLVNLLIEPNMPKLNMTITGQSVASAYLNGAPLKMNERKIEDLPLEQGWNHILIRVERGEARNWAAGVRLESNNQEFFRQIKTSLAMP